ncbi:DUF3343 domain-containing protein [Acutalibacter sp. 1XD8-33]|uniref:DUF3343 domain-containing protein n=1 Tax=Acutalibacter sp. 1XD8-33 TaxID=2320081 RepID=UPI000EA22831|nr:DUF3343 domain-containing protein [Acutalibacter sp. 1XD8-33]RKJ41331.1 DUF3343 domain-containing protein [Acutalibacter sp. 1XD8-33]
MSKPIILVGSVTYAMKSRDLLFQRGIRAFVERVPPTEASGCGYGVRVPQGADEAEQILRENKIKILGRIEQEAAP